MTCSAMGSISAARAPAQEVPAFKKYSTFPQDRTGRCSVSALRSSDCWGRRPRRASENNASYQGDSIHVI